MEIIFLFIVVLGTMQNLVYKKCSVAFCVLTLLSQTCHL
uniref:Uncharacterized protein n=1 Tax=Arundo donax TaxID=35708 RepID=A0A0A9G4U7_ARUDO